MKQTKRSFTLVEVVIVIVVLLLVGVVIAVSMGIASGGVVKARNKAQMGQCANNLKQISVTLFQYEMTYQTEPIYSVASATTTTDGQLCAANLMRLYVSGLNDDLKGFVCPVGQFTPTPADAAASTAIVQANPNGAKYTSYNLTTCYAQDDPANKIIIADMPFAKGNVSASIHDSDATKIDLGPNCLFKDGHVANVQSLCPEKSSEHDLSASGNIYRVDGGAGKGKDTCILGVDR